METKAAGTIGDELTQETAVSKLHELADNGILTCTQVSTFARRNSIELEEMKPLLKAAGIRLKDCEQTCISRRCNYFSNK